MSLEYPELLPGVIGTADSHCILVSTTRCTDRRVPDGVERFDAQAAAFAGVQTGFGCSLANARAPVLVGADVDHAG